MLKFGIHMVFQFIAIGSIYLMAKYWNCSPTELMVMFIFVWQFEEILNRD